MLIVVASVMWIVQGREHDLLSWFIRLMSSFVGVVGLLVCVWCFLPHA